MSEIQVYADNAIKKHIKNLDIVNNGILPNIPALFAARVQSTPTKEAYRQYDEEQNSWISYNWQEIAQRVVEIRTAIANEGFSDRARAAIRIKNSVNWVAFDQAVLASNMVVVPLYADDRAENIHYILQDTATELLLVEHLEQWQDMAQESDNLDKLKRIVVINAFESTDDLDQRVISLQQWLDDAPKSVLQQHQIGSTALATIVYTSGTTGRPKGVMLSHQNILDNAFAGLKSVAVFPQDVFLSFLPLSHMFERTVGYYLTMMAGATVVYNRSIPMILKDLSVVKPTAMIAVPRIFEKAHTNIANMLEESSSFKQKLFEKAVEIGWHRFEMKQHRASWKASQLLWPLLNRLVASKVRERFGGRLRFAVVGGAPLSKNVSQLFIGLGVDLLQGYGLTECSPVITVNTEQKNKPETIGLALHGMHLKLSEEGELLVKSSSVMRGYWNNQEATDETIDNTGWLHTGDIAHVDEEGFISITGRIKEIIVLSNGEKLPPADLEMAICEDNMFDQAMVVGEGRPYMTALLVLNQDNWLNFSHRNGLPAERTDAVLDAETRQLAKQRLEQCLEHFPGYAFIKNFVLIDEPWSVENGQLTPTLKLKRPVILEQFAEQIESMYSKNPD